MQTNTKNMSRLLAAIVLTLMLMIAVAMAGIASLHTQTANAEESARAAADAIPTPEMEFTITNGTGATFTATEKDGKLTDGITDVPLADLIAAIDAARTFDDINYAAVAFNFGDTTALDLGTNPLDLANGSYIIQSGTVKSDCDDSGKPTINFSGTALYITGGTIQNLNTNGGARTLLSSGTGKIIMNDGTVAATGGRTIHNSSTGEVIINGGTISATSGYAIYGASTGKITISQADDATPTRITSVKNAAGQGTIMLNSSGSEDTVVLEITGGTIENTFATGSNARAIQNTQNGNININGGTISAAGSGTAIYNNGTGALDISGGTVSANTGYGIYNNSTGKITISETNSAILSTITSKNVTAGQATIYLASGTAAETILEVTGGTIKNTANDTNARTISNYGAGNVHVGSGVVSGNRGNLIMIGSSGGISIDDGAAITAGNANAIYSVSGSTGNINIDGGTISSDGAGVSTVYNGGSGAVTVTGGNISAADGHAIFSNSTGKITISQADDLLQTFITSARSESSRGTIHMNNAGSTLEILGGEINNSAGGNLVSNAANAAVTLGTESFAGTLAMTLSGNMAYIGSAVTPTVTITGLVSSAFTVNYLNNTNAGAAKVSATLSGDYGSAVFSIGFTVAKADGGTVSAPAISGKIMTSSITINAVTAPLSGQTVEYAISTTDSEPLDGWQTGLTFDGLTSNTAYYVFARSAENANYSAGTAVYMMVTTDTITSPSITGGQTTITLTEGYTATSTSAFTITGSDIVTVTKFNGDAKITWNDNTNKLDIAAGLSAGTYTVTLKASNGTYPDALYTFTLKVEAAIVPPTAPTITDGQATMTLTESYTATATSAFTIGGDGTVTVTKLNGDAKITWNDTTKKFDIATGLSAGTYVVTLKASNGTYPDALYTFTLTVNVATITPPTAPTITGGQTTMTLTEGYTATATSAFTVTGSDTVTITKVNGDAKITWNDTTKKFDIAAGLSAGTYVVMLKASNGTYPDALFTFTLTVTGDGGGAVETPDNGLSAGAAVGITLGATVAVFLGGFSVIWFVIKKKKFSDLGKIFKKD